jgi:ATP-dependent protease ClpP protease subunit
MDTTQLKYCLNPNSENPIFLINGNIGYDELTGKGINGSDWQNEFMFVDSLNPKKISVWINSGGGSVVDGYNIYNAITKSVSNVDTYAYGMCASMAAIIFQAGRNRVMSDIAVMMLHNPMSSANPNPEMIEAVRDGLINAVVNKSGKTKEEIGAMFNKTSWFSAQSCMDNSLCDSIYVSGLNKKVKPEPSNMEAVLNDYELILNSYIEQKKENMEQFEELKAFLSLEKVTESDILNSLKAKDLEIEEVNNSLASITADFEALKNEIEKAKVEKEGIELVENAVLDGKINAEAKESFLKLVNSNFEDTKAVIEALKVNKVAPVIDIKNSTSIKEGREGWTIRDYEKKAPKELEQIKNELPHVYEQMYNDFYKN